MAHTDGLGFRGQGAQGVSSEAQSGQVRNEAKVSSSNGHTFRQMLAEKFPKLSAILDRFFGEKVEAPTPQPIKQANANLDKQQKPSAEKSGTVWQRNSQELPSRPSRPASSNQAASPKYDQGALRNSNEVKEFQKGVTPTKAELPKKDYADKPTVAQLPPKSEAPARPASPAPSFKMNTTGNPTVAQLPPKQPTVAELPKKEAPQRPTSAAPTFKMSEEKIKDSASENKENAIADEPPAPPPPMPKDFKAKSAAREEETPKQASDAPAPPPPMPKDFKAKSATREETPKQTTAQPKQRASGGGLSDDLKNAITGGNFKLRTSQETPKEVKRTSGAFGGAFDKIKATDYEEVASEISDDEWGDSEEEIATQARDQADNQAQIENERRIKEAKAKKEKEDAAKSDAAVNKDTTTIKENAAEHRPLDLKDITKRRGHISGDEDGLQNSDDEDWN